MPVNEATILNLYFKESSLDRVVDIVTSLLEDIEGENKHPRGKEHVSL